MCGGGGGVGNQLVNPQGAGVMVLVPSPYNQVVQQWEMSQQVIMFIVLCISRIKSPFQKQSVLV